MGSSQFKEYVFPILFKIMTEENLGFSILWKQTFPSNLAWRIACLLELNSRLIRERTFSPTSSTWHSWILTCLPAHSRPPQSTVQSHSWRPLMFQR